MCFSKYIYTVYVKVFCVVFVQVTVLVFSEDMILLGDWKSNSDVKETESFDCYEVKLRRRGKKMFT